LELGLLERRQKLPRLRRGAETGAEAPAPPPELLLLLVGKNLVKLAPGLLLGRRQQFLLLVGQISHVRPKRPHNLETLPRGAEHVFFPLAVLTVLGGEAEAARARPLAALGRVDVFPNGFFLGRHFKERAVGPRADQRVAVGQALGAGNEEREEVRLLRRG